MCVLCCRFLSFRKNLYCVCSLGFGIQEESYSVVVECVSRVLSFRRNLYSIGHI